MYSNVNDFVKFADSGSNSLLSVDRDDTGVTYGWTQIATLENAAGLAASTLFGANDLVVL